VSISYLQTQILSSPYPQTVARLGDAVWYSMFNNIGHFNILRCDMVRYGKTENVLWIWGSPVRSGEAVPRRTRVDRGLAALVRLAWRGVGRASLF
jgi:hypothetical protein